MKWFKSALVVLLCATTLFTSSSFAQDSQAKKKILVLTFSGGYKHSSLALAEEIIAHIGEQTGVYEADCLGLYKLEPHQIDLSFLTADYLDKYDAVFFYTTTGEVEKDLLTDDQKKAFADYIRSGRGAYIGSHSASDTFYNWEDYNEIVGGYFNGHPWGANSDPVTIKVEDPNHPATKMLGDKWVIQDEIYQFKPGSFSRERSHVLLSLDDSKTDMDRDGLNDGKDGDYPVSWCHYFGDGRCFYTSLGHREDVWANKTFQEHLLGGIKWALGLSEGKPEK
ncbi:MAG: ThuA domain-containing protein [Candidatus Omnitrophica bacterium]|nr:ThuA domain-containing protein [Candidatus Omnitrophota bacterium]